MKTFHTTVRRMPVAVRYEVQQAEIGNPPRVIVFDVIDPDCGDITAFVSKIDMRRIEESILLDSMREAA
jgi:hypothetical protein